MDSLKNHLFFFSFLVRRFLDHVILQEPLFVVFDGNTEIICQKDVEEREEILFQCI